MWVQFLKSRQGLAYFAGDRANLDKKIADKLINEGFAKNAEEPEESDLPLDLPGRVALISGGLRQKAQVLASRDALTDIKGIGAKTAEEILLFLSK